MRRRFPLGGLGMDVTSKSARRKAASSAAKAITGAAKPESFPLSTPPFAAERHRDWKVKTLVSQMGLVVFVSNLHCNRAFERATPLLGLKTMLELSISPMHIPAVCRMDSPITVDTLLFPRPRHSLQPNVNAECQSRSILSFVVTSARGAPSGRPEVQARHFLLRFLPRPEIRSLYFSRQNYAEVGKKRDLVVTGTSIPMLSINVDLATNVNLHILWTSCVRFQGIPNIKPSFARPSLRYILRCRLIRRFKG
jgi:hypothetical protein